MKKELDMELFSVETLDEMEMDSILGGSGACGGNNCNCNTDNKCTTKKNND